MKYGPREKGRMPALAIEYLLSAFPNFGKDEKHPRSSRRNALASFFHHPEDPEMPTPGEVKAVQPVSPPELVSHIPRARKEKAFEEDDDRSLTMRIDAKLSCGCCGVHLDVLVDTGATVNLIKKGIIPTYLFKPAKRKMSLVAANGKVIPGGGEVHHTHLGYGPIYWR